MDKTKIVCTLGPASKTAELIGHLLDAGMSAARLNFSHGRYEDHAASIERVREAAGGRDRMIPIIGDLQGPKIRTGPIEGGGPVELKAGESLRVTNQPVSGGPGLVSLDYASLAKDVQPGDQILLDDGAIELRVSGLDGEDILCKVVSGGLLAERKGVNIPGAALDLPSLTKKDEDDLEFAMAQGLDYVALSFVRRAEDVRALQKKIGAHNLPIIAKLEKPQALDHLDEILEAADGVMVARGDLGVEVSPWKVPVEQKRIIDQANRLRKPVITATQMLQSMIQSPSPTRAEASDVANAVFDGSDAVMLSGETAVGEYPVESVRMMSRIINAAETSMAEVPYQPVPVANHKMELSDAVAESAVQLAERLGAKYIVVYTESGYTARLISKYRPRSLILGLSRHQGVCRRMKLLWGVRARLVESVDDVDHLVPIAESLLLNLGWVKPRDLICLVAGTPFLIGGNTNLIKLHRIGDVAAG